MNERVFDRECQLIFSHWAMHPEASKKNEEITVREKFLMLQHLISKRMEKLHN
jgi:hypothetical protein